ALRPMSSHTPLPSQQQRTTWQGCSHKSRCAPNPGRSIRLRGWRRRSWLRAAAWTGAWVGGFALMGLIVVAGWSWANGSGAPDVAWGELPIVAAWLALGAVMTSVLAKPPTRPSREAPAAP